MSGEFSNMEICSHMNNFWSVCLATPLKIQARLTQQWNLAKQSWQSQPSTPATTACIPLTILCYTVYESYDTTYIWLFTDSRQCCLYLWVNPWHKHSECDRCKHGSTADPSIAVGKLTKEETLWTSQPIEPIHLVDAFMCLWIWHGYANRPGSLQLRFGFDGFSRCKLAPVPRIHTWPVHVANTVNQQKRWSFNC